LNFSATAKQCFITQPTVSNQIKKLENELGVKLVSRSSHGVLLTAEGEEFLKYASQILSIHEIAENRINNMSRGMFGHIRIAAIPSASQQLCDCLVKLYDVYPQIQVDIDLLGGPEMIPSMYQGAHDFYFASYPMIPTSRGLTCCDINREIVELFVNKKIRDTIDLNDWKTVERHPFVSITQNDVTLSGLVRHICKNRGIEPRIINYYNRAESIVLSVNAGIGISLLPESLGLLYQRPNVVTLPVIGEDAIIVTVAAWRNKELNAVGKIFRDIVSTVYP